MSALFPKLNIMAWFLPSGSGEERARAGPVEAPSFTGRNWTTLYVRWYQNINECIFFFKKTTFFVFLRQVGVMPSPRTQDPLLLAQVHGGAGRPCSY